MKALTKYQNISNKSQIKIVFLTAYDNVTNNTNNDYSSRINNIHKVKMKLYQKITLITTILSLIVPLSVIFVYFFIDSLMEIPILGVFIANAVLISVEIIAKAGRSFYCLLYKKYKSSWISTNFMRSNSNTNNTAMGYSRFCIVYSIWDNGIKRKTPLTILMSKIFIIFTRLLKDKYDYHKLP